MREKVGNFCIGHREELPLPPPVREKGVRETLVPGYVEGGCQGHDAVGLT